MDIVTLLTDRHKVKELAKRLTSLRAEQMAAAQDRFRRLEAVASALHGLCTCESSPMFGSSTTVWSLVADYRSTPRGRGMMLTQADLIVVPEMVLDQVLHRPTPDPINKNRSHWSPRTVSGAEIAHEAAANKKFGLRIGRTSEAKLEKCPSCEAQAAIVCQRDWDYDNGVQSIVVFRLCLDCPTLDHLAAAFGDIGANLTAG
jgi:hypothetical protein